MKHYPEHTKELSKYISKIRKEHPDVMHGFATLATAATKDGALDHKTKELITLAIAVTGHCEGCIGFHAAKLAKLSAKREEVIETLGVAILMGGGPSLMYAAEALKAFEEFSE